MQNARFRKILSGSNRRSVHKRVSSAWSCSVVARASHACCAHGGRHVEQRARGRNRLQETFPAARRFAEAMSELQRSARVLLRHQCPVVRVALAFRKPADPGNL